MAAESQPWLSPKRLERPQAALGQDMHGIPRSYHVSMGENTLAVQATASVVTHAVAIQFSALPHRSHCQSVSPNSPVIGIVIGLK